MLADKRLSGRIEFNSTRCQIRSGLATLLLACDDKNTGNSPVSLDNDTSTFKWSGFILNHLICFYVAVIFIANILITHLFLLINY